MNDSDIALRPCTAADWDFVIGITGACMRVYAEQTWGQWIPESPDTFTPETHAVIQYRGIDIGCMEVVVTADALRLGKLYIGPAHQNKGVGGVLLTRLMARARGENLPVVLSVLKVNPARRLYERHGFRITSSPPERHWMEWKP